MTNVKLSSKAHVRGNIKRAKTTPLTFLDLSREIRQQVLSLATARILYDRSLSGSFLECVNEPEALAAFVRGLNYCMPTVEALSKVGSLPKHKLLEEEIKGQIKILYSVRL